MKLTFYGDGDEAYRRAALAQKKDLRDAADVIEAGGSLEGFSLMGIAAVLRDAADRIPLTRKKKRGNPNRKLDHGDTALRYQMLTGSRVKRRNGKQALTHAQAVALLAERAQATIEAVNKALKAQNLPLVKRGKTKSGD